MALVVGSHPTRVNVAREAATVSLGRLREDSAHAKTAVSKKSVRIYARPQQPFRVVLVRNTVVFSFHHQLPGCPCFV